MEINPWNILAFVATAIAVVAGIFALFFWYQDKQEEKAKPH